MERCNRSGPILAMPAFQTQPAFALGAKVIRSALLRAGRSSWNCAGVYIHLFLLLLLPLGWSSLTAAQESADAIVQRSVEANQRDWDAAPKFNCSERDYGHNGTKTYEDTMLLGSPYRRLVAVNGIPLSPSRAAAEKRKLENTVTQRQRESPQKRAQRVAKYEADRKRDHALMGEMVKAFDFKLQNETKLDGHDVYVLQAKPRPGYQPPNMETKALTGMQGTLWIDKNTFQWVKVEAEVTHPVSIEGLLARVEPGTHFELEKTPVAPGVWLPKHFSMRSRAKVLLLYNREGGEEENYFNFQEAQTNSGTR